MRIILLGPPGAGKGTQAPLLCAHYQIAHISTGDMLRAEIRAASELGRRAQSFVECGKLAPDDLLIAMVERRIQAPDCKAGFLLDGFPRTRAQAEALDRAGVRVDCVLEITAADAALVERVTGRRVHPASGRVYHIKFNPPKTPETDNETGEPLIARADDSEEKVRRRLADYRAQTEPLIDYYRGKAGADKPRFLSVLGEGEIADIFAAIRADIKAGGV